MSMPIISVSVIIPTYNEAQTIKDCLFSLSRQDFTQFELIVVDDGSSDETLNIVKEFKKVQGKSIQILAIEQAHKGPGLARNYGASLAKGTILIFVDADMTFDPKFIKELIAPILKGEEIGAICMTEPNAGRHPYELNMALFIGQF